MIAVRTAWVVALVSLSGCHAPETASSGWNAWTKAGNAYAQRFQIWKRGEERLLLVFGPGGVQDTIGAYRISTGASGAVAPIAATSFANGLNAIAVGSTTHVPFISQLGHIDAIVACAHMGQVRDNAFVARARHGAAKEIATGDGLDREALLMMKPDALFGYPFGRGE